MKFKLLDAVFKINGDQLEVNNQPYECKKNTLDTLLIFLQSDGEVISKDDILSQVWKDVIVSDASVFKQVQLVREIFVDSGIPRDVIENVYGRGYKIKYTIETTDDINTTHHSSSQFKKTKSGKKWFVAIIALLVLAVTAFFYIKPQDKQDFFNEAKKESLNKMLRSDWEGGLKHFQELLKNDTDKYSKRDLAFLYNKIGLSQYHLQNFKESNENYLKALKLYQETNRPEWVGQIHLNLATNYGYLTDEPDFIEKEKSHIFSAIEILKEANDTIKLIDAKMVLAAFYKKHSSIKESMDLYEEIINDAKNARDNVGEMIAINNLAATYVIVNDYDKAIELGQQGLQMALATGTGRYIANSYSFLSDLYQNQYQSEKALEMIQQAIKHQLANNEFSYLSPKIFTLGFVLVQTFQFEKANVLLDTLLNYLEVMKNTKTQSVAYLYKGMNAARQGDWKNAEDFFKQSRTIAQKGNFIYKQPLNLAYLSLSLYFNQNYIQAIEPATEVVNNEESDEHSKAIAALSLAYTYFLMERQELADKWFSQAQNELNPKWLFEYKLFLQLKLERQHQSNSVLIPQTEQEIADLDLQIQNLSQVIKVDEEIYQNLLKQIAKKMTSEEK